MMPDHTNTACDTCPSCGSDMAPVVAVSVAPGVYKVPTNFAWTAGVGTGKRGEIPSTTYRELVAKLGQPNAGPSGDGKVQFEWVFIWDGKVYTIHDYIGQGADHPERDRYNWSLGGAITHDEARAFAKRIGLPYREA